VADGLTGNLAGQLGRLGWDAGRLARHQRARLRALLRHAARHSAFHSARLAGFDPGRFELADLPRLPVMTKEQLMASFDEVVTDPRLRRGAVEAHLAAGRQEPRLLLGEYVCLASGGSSGRRGVFVQTVTEFTAFVAALVREPMARPPAARPGVWWSAWSGPPRPPTPAVSAPPPPPAHRSG
jgi:phenylacetate-CoA ligase